jgi:hypothetical protein
LAVVLTGCTGADPDRFVKPGAPKVSPSGVYTAAVDAGPNQNGVDTWVAVILDDTGAEVFHDDYAYSTRHGAGITWLSTSDQLWLLSADIGAAHVDRHPDGTWTKTAITPETNDSVPSEIRELMDA